jgi:cytochrome d ubiquinol oxidase subunit II
MVSSTSDAFSLTVENAAASQKTLEIMTVVALIFVPIVLIYQGWSYWVFRQRISVESELEY